MNRCRHRLPESGGLGQQIFEGVREQCGLMAVFTFDVTHQVIRFLEVTIFAFTNAFSHKLRGSGSHG